MIIQCGSCSRKFVVKNIDIPEEGRMVQCGYCSITWHQMPDAVSVETIQKSNINKTVVPITDSLSVDKIEASDGKTYKFLGSQWAELLPSGKTGLFAKRKIVKELDKLTGRKEKNISQKKQKKTKKKEVDPSLDDLDNEKRLPDIHKPGKSFGFFGFIFLMIIIAFSLIGVLKTFENDLLNYFPETEYIFQLLDKQLVYVSESVNNMIVIIKDLINNY